jgi:amidohydrolase
MMDLLTAARGLEDRLVSWRRSIHRHPELGFREHRTAELILEALEAAGVPCEAGIGGTGVVGRLGRGHPAVGLRADMDALPIQEANEVSYASQVPGVMHACGHDAHTAMLLGAAELLTGLPDRPAGEVRFLFQPSEETSDDEGLSGAARMVETGALKGLDAVIAIHVDSAAAAGTVGVREGPVAAGVDAFSATIIGHGSHSALPHQGISPIAILAQVVQAVQGAPTLRVDPLEPAILAIETVHGGAGTGVIPDRVELTGNIRSFSEEVRSTLHRELRRALEIARLNGGDYDLTITTYGPALMNDGAVTEVIRKTALAMGGREALWEPRPRLYGEDFAVMTRQVPGALAFLGVRAGTDERPLHTPTFDIDESALPVGAALLAGSALRVLSGGLPS